MPRFFVNGKEVEAPPGEKLIRVLRDRLRLTSVMESPWKRIS